MLRRISQTLSGVGGAPDRAPSPEFISRDAGRIENRHFMRVNRPESLRTPDKYGAAEAYRLASSLDALNLEPINSVGLPRLDARTYIDRDLPPLPPVPVIPAALADRAEPPTLPPRARVSPPRSPREAVIVAEVRPGFTLVDDPFEFDATPIRPFVVTQFPRRPLARRNALSYRTERDLPLRVQAMRRSQQAQYARELSQRSMHMAMPRRGSAPQLTVRNPDPAFAPAPPVVREPPRIQRPPPKRRIVARAPSSLHSIPEDRPVLPSPSGSAQDLRERRREQDTGDRDYYLEAAEAREWSDRFIEEWTLR